MADAARTNFSFHRQWTSYPGQFNVAFITLRCYFSQEHRAPTFRQTTFAFIVPVLLNFLELMYQGKAFSPFETHPKTMLIAITSFFMYCWAYDAELRFSSTRPSLTYTRAIHRCMMLFGLLAVVSLASILFPPCISPVMYLLYILLTAGELVRCRHQMLWNWLNQRITGEHSGDILPV